MYSKTCTCPDSHTIFYILLSYRSWSIMPNILTWNSAHVSTIFQWTQGLRKKSSRYLISNIYFPLFLIICYIIWISKQVDLSSNRTIKRLKILYVVYMYESISFGWWIYVKSREMEPLFLKTQESDPILPIICGFSMNIIFWVQKLYKKRILETNYFSIIVTQ